ncbi:MIP18 family protein [Trichoplax sp. H2]|nr:MIP18 family protein [Trichoplax sp. H2]|eukprot:RDD46955.1 MIP18 family protein [Trichoplax sp. H2]
MATWHILLQTKAAWSLNEKGEELQPAIGLENINPTVFSKSKEREILPEELDDNIVDKIDEREIFDILQT